MNCFHFSVSLGYKTTFPFSVCISASLWIAFIFQYLWDTKQLLTIDDKTANCCELLSFFSIFGIQNNSASISCARFLVVNCFHFSVSLGYKTTLQIILIEFPQLWIAFIFQYLWDTKQLKESFREFVYSCELLSFFSIFGIQNNLLPSILKPLVVVNCFHFSVSLGYKTTKILCFGAFIVLWIAFIFQYLWDTKQPTADVYVQFYVVNCFHFSVSLGYKTTPRQK